MAHGAPDHTRLADDAYSHYTFTRLFTPVTVIPMLSSIIPINENFVGVFGKVVMVLDNVGLTVKIEIDGVKVFELSPSYIMNSLYLEDRSVNADYGMTCYDTVNDNYGIWFSTGYNIYVRANLNIEISNAGGVARNLRTMRTYIKKYR